MKRKRLRKANKSKSTLDYRTLAVGALMDLLVGLILLLIDRLTQ